MVHSEGITIFVTREEEVDRGIIYGQREERKGKAKLLMNLFVEIETRGYCMLCLAVLF
jgi:hypothetical protein